MASQLASGVTGKVVGWDYNGKSGCWVQQRRSGEGTARLFQRRLLRAILPTHQQNQAQFLSLKPRISDSNDAVFSLHDCALKSYNV